MRYFSLFFIALLFSGCFNKHGVSIKYYSDCDEYYDAQGYYHKECGKDDVMTYTQMQEKGKQGFEAVKRGTKRTLNRAKETSNEIIDNLKE